LVGTRKSLFSVLPSSVLVQGRTVLEVSVRLFTLYLANVDALNILRRFSLLDFLVKLIRALALFLLFFVAVIGITWRTARGTVCIN